MRKTWNGNDGTIEYCNGKVSYDKKTAVTAANRRFRESHTKLRVYNCPDCGKWHLTHVMHYGERKNGGKMKRW